jgi:FHS family L-fucose permease-like MFS transporter
MIESPMSRRPRANRTALSAITLVFFMWGLITSLNDVLVPHLKALFSLDYTHVMLVQFTFFGAYFLMSLPSGQVVSRWGYKASIVLGLAITGGGALLFYPAAALPSFPLFLAAFFTLATGITVLQVAANPYVSLLGPARTASSRLNLAQALNSLGTTVGPSVGGMLILSGTLLSAAAVDQLTPDARVAYRAHQASLVQGPYLGLALILFVLAAGIWLLHLPAVAEPESADRAAAGPHAASTPLAAPVETATDREPSLLEALRVRHLRLGVVAIFVYVGAEVSIGSFLINYISLPEIGHMTQATAATYVSLYWGGAMVGRFVGAAALQRLDPRRLLGLFAAIAAALVATTMISDGSLALWSIVAVGLFNSIMFPTIFALGIEGLGPLTGRASSLLIMAIVGGAIVPVLQGLLADSAGVHHAFVLPLLCYLFIVYYGFRGSQIQVPSTSFTS